MEKQLISVIMPVYNSEKFVDKAIKSILNQSYSNLELIILNDGSTDNSSEVIKRFNDGRIRFYSSENCGCSRQRNFGISVANGKYIALMDSDDISDHRRLEKQYSFLIENPNIQVTGTNCININEAGREMFFKNLPETHSEIEFISPVLCPICPPTMMTRTEVLKQVFGYRDDLKVAGDYDLILRMLSNGFKFHNLKEYLYHYRIHKNSLSATKLELQKRNHYDSSIAYLNNSPKISFNIKYYDYRRGLLEYYYGKTSESRKYLLKALLNGTAPTIRALRLVLTSFLGDKNLNYLRNKGILSLINRIYYQLFNVNLQKIKIKN